MRLSSILQKLESKLYVNAVYKILIRHFKYKETKHRSQAKNIYFLSILSSLFSYFTHTFAVIL